MYYKKNVTRAAGSPGMGIQPRDVLTLIDVDDIAYFPDRDDKGVVIAEDIILKDEAYPITLYVTPGTTEVTSAADGDPDQVGFNTTVKGTHPGNEQEVREFKANNINTKFVVIVRYCSGKAADLIGDPCNPCKMTPSFTGNKDASTNEITFERITKGEDIAIYKGAIPAAEPVTTVAGGSTSVTFVAEGQYQLSAGESAASITTISGGSHGALITLVGVAGLSPSVSVAESGNILLKDGAAFSATAGSQITLRAFATGAANLVWIEQSRYEAA